MTVQLATIQDPMSREDEIDLREVLGTLRDYRWRIALIVLAFIAMSVVYVLLVTPVYQATSIVQVEQKVPSLPGLSALTQTLGASDSTSTTESALITSRMVVGAAVDKLNLKIESEPKRFPIIGNFIARHFTSRNPGKLASPMLGMSRYDWGGSRLEVFQLDVPDSLMDQPLRLTAGENGVYILQDKDDNVLLVGKVGQFSQAHGVSAQVWSMTANPGMRFRVVRHRDLTVINKLQKAITTTELGKDSGILQLTYNNTNAGLAAEFLQQVGELYVRQDIDRNSAEAASSLKFVREQLPNVRRDLEKATAALNAFQNQAHSVDVSMQTQSLLDQSVSIDTSLQQLQLQQAQMQRQFTPQHPAYKALVQQIGQLQGQKAAIEKKVNGLPDTQQELLKLNRDVQVTNDTYTGLLNQAQQLDIARAGTVGNVRIIDKAAVDVTNPIWPKNILVLLGGTLLGGFVALVYVFMREALNRGIEDPAVIERIGLPVYATIPVSIRERSLQARRTRGDGRQHMLVVDAPKDLAAEALRSLRTSLHFARLEAKNNVLMISGASPNAGKTFVAANLAGVITQSGQRVLLIDGDMRMGSLHKVLGGRPDVGLSEVISGQAELVDAVRKVPSLENLHFLPRGKVPPNPSELLMNAKFSDLVNHLKARYDLVIIDTPPILVATDASVIGHHCGTGLLVVRFGLNQVRELAVAKQRFEHDGVVIKGAIFNAVEKRASGYYSYAYYELGDSAS